MPCPEPCSVLLALCREAAVWQQERPHPTRRSPSHTSRPQGTGCVRPTSPQCPPELPLDNASLRGQARTFFPGGVSSPVRSFRSVGAEPIPIVRAAEARVYDADGREHVDYVAAGAAALDALQDGKAYAPDS